MEEHKKGDRKCYMYNKNDCSPLEISLRIRAAFTQRPGIIGGLKKIQDRWFHLPDPSEVDFLKYESVTSLVGCGLESNFRSDMQDTTYIHLRVHIQYVHATKSLWNVEVIGFFTAGDTLL
jgi:hypothetical protein